MKYIYYKDKQGNFGDDLNAWLWPFFFGKCDEEEQNKLFYGIGTILSKGTKLVNENSAIPKVIFGTGVRPYFDPLILDDSWEVKFVRGPLSSMSLRGGVEFITDSAYAIRQLETFGNYINSPKKYEISIMPHISSARKLDWKRLCKKVGFHYISPYSEKGVEHTIKEIAASRCLISEAMHGAIIADALRVPWKRFILFTQLAEGNVVSEFKWMDWLFSIKMSYTISVPIRVLNTTVLHNFIRKMSLGIIHVKFSSKIKVQNNLVMKLANLQSSDFYLSDENVLKDIDKNIAEKIHELQGEMFNSDSTGITNE